MYLGRILRSNRKELGFTLKDVAEKTGLSIGFLSQVERDQATPSLSALVTIAETLQTDISELINAPRNLGAVTRANEREFFKLADANISYARLSTEFSGQHLNAVEMVLAPGYESETISHSGEEIVYVLEGKYKKVIDGKEYVLEKGDSAHFPSSLPHSWSNPTDQPARILWFGDLPIFTDQKGQEG